MLRLRPPENSHVLAESRLRQLTENAEAHHLRNAFSGILMYPVLALAGLVGTDLTQLQPTAAYGLMGAIGAICILRGWIPFRFEAMTPRNRDLAIRLFNLGGLASAGLFTTLTLTAWHTQGLSQDTLICLLLSAGLSAGAVTGVCMNLPLAYGFLALTLPPLALLGFLQGTPDALAIGITMFAYAIMILRFGRNGHRAYWDAAVSSALLAEKTALLELDVEAVLQSAQDIARGRTHAEVAQGILVSALEHSGSSRAALLLEREGRLHLVAQSPTSGPPHSRLATDDDAPLSWLSDTLHKGTPIQIADTSQEPGLSTHPYFETRTPRSVLLIPITSRQQTLGALYLEHETPDHRCSEQRLGVLSMLGAQAAISLENTSHLEALDHQRHWLATTLSCIQDAVITTDTQGIISSCNPAAADLLDSVEVDVVGRPLEEVFQLEDEPLHSVSEGEPDKRLVLGDGTHRRIALARSPIVGAKGSAMGHVVVFRDVSVEREQQARMHHKQRIESIGRLTGGIAHDFNNMLTILMNYAATLLPEVPPGTARDDVQGIKETIERAKKLTRQLLAFGRQQILVPKNMDLNKIVSDMQDILRRLLVDDIEMKLALTPDLGLTLVDRVQLEQVILNLVINARDALDTGGQITVETRQQRVTRSNSMDCPPGTYVVLVVRDNGKGMAPSTLERIFEPFFTTKPEGRGTGLGLATVHGIVRQSHGYIAVASVVGEGTAVSVYLPLSHGPSREPAIEVRQDATDTDHTILVVDDNAAIRMLTGRILEKRGYRVHASDGRNLQAWSNPDKRIDLLLADLNVPGTSGVQIAEELSRHQPDIRILFMSGQAPDPPLDSDARPLLEKPFTPQQLATAVQKALR